MAAEELKEELEKEEEELLEEELEEDFEELEEKLEEEERLEEEDEEDEEEWSDQLHCADCPGTPFTGPVVAVSAKEPGVSVEKTYWNVCSCPGPRRIQ